MSDGSGDEDGSNVVPVSDSDGDPDLEDNPPSKWFVGLQLLLLLSVELLTTAIVMCDTFCTGEGNNRSVPGPQKKIKCPQSTVHSLCFYIKIISIIIAVFCFV
jgi:hypothetical protein